MKTLDTIANFLSWATLLALAALVCSRRFAGWSAPAWVELYASPILTAAAVGYLTNRIAIWLLFKPYERRWGFFQGVIPRNRARLGHELGVIVPEYLLKPEELADRLSGLADEYLRDPELLDDLRAKANLLFARSSAKIAAFLIPCLENALAVALRDNLTQEKLSDFYERTVLAQWNELAVREKLAGMLVAELKTRAPELAGLIRGQLRLGAADYVRTEHPKLAAWFNADEFAAKLVDYLNWERIETQISGKLGEPATRAAVGEELTAATLRLRDWLRAPESHERLQSFLAGARGPAEAMLREYLTEHLPLLAEDYLRRDELWRALREQALPPIRSFVLHRLKRGKGELIRRFDLPGKIERSVSEMDMAQLHKMIDRASGENLTAIQLLGYLLGGAAGVLLSLAG